MGNLYHDSISSRNVNLKRNVGALVSTGVLIAGFGLLSAPAAQAAPPPGLVPTTVTQTGSFSVPAPEGTCSVQITIEGGAGGDANNNGTEGAGAVIVLGPIAISQGQLIAGSVGGAGSANRTAGANGGGTAGNGTTHEGGGGGGYTDVSVNGGPRLAIAGGGGGNGGGHVPTNGFGGDAGIPIGNGTFAGEDGTAGVDPSYSTPGGGQGGQLGAGGAGGVHPSNAARSGTAGSAFQGGNGGADANADTGGGGGGGLFGGGGGASTLNEGPAQNGRGPTGAAGGGGGTSFVAATAPFVSGAFNDSGAGSATLAWKSCVNPTVVNDAQNTVQDQPVTFNPTDNDSAGVGSTIDPTSVRLLDGGTPVTTLINSDGTYTVDTATGEVTFTPAAGFTGTAAPVGYRVADDSGRPADALITITVGPVVGIPMINGPVAGGVGLLVLLIAGGVFVGRRRLVGER